jgi:hypothetical protein
MLPRTSGDGDGDGELRQPTQIIPRRLAWTGVDEVVELQSSDPAARADNTAWTSMDWRGLAWTR